MGKYCQTALCYPQCMNGGFCSAPAVCSCPKGYQGRHCEGGNKKNQNHLQPENPNGKSNNVLLNNNHVSCLDK